MHAALFLVLAFFTAAAIWLLLRAEFLAIALVLVYVGAVMVLFLFVVMMLDINLERLREGFWQNLPLGAGGGRADGVRDGRGAGASAVSALAAPPGVAARRLQQHQGAGPRCCTRDYVYAFEIAAVILLVAIVAAIALTLRRRKDTQGAGPVASRCAARRADRVRLVSMPSEKDR